MVDLFGQGLKWPYTATPAGRLALKSGSDRIMDSVEQIIRTPKGSCPLDPEYGFEIDAYEVATEGLAWQLADAIEYGEPRAGAIDVAILEDDPNNGTISVRVTITPINDNVPVNRVFNLYELAS